jgi:fructan beta-fructosidase
MNILRIGLVGLLLGGAVAARAADRPDIVFADFEGKDYGDWEVTGTAFGTGPAKGTLPNQMAVTGFRGKGLVNSYHGGDDSTGTLKSPPFKIQRKFLNFLIGGGKYPGQTCINLLIEGKVVRTATGPNDQPGGSERLDWHSWNVADFDGKTATIEIVDKRTGGWGHICIDHIVQSDRREQAEPAQRAFLIGKRYLHLPVRTGAPMRRMQFIVEDKVEREFEIELADAEPEFWVFSDVSAFKGKKLAVETTTPGAEKALALITQGDAIRDADSLYQEKQRPQFHFTSRRGWLNDPNGLVYFQGEYHLFFQHNPYGWSWGNMHWGHAVSKDLVHWQELPIGLYPRRFNDWAFSGSAVVDPDNTSAFGKNDEPPLVLAYTSTGRGECIAFSNDRGRTWNEYSGNPVVKHAGRDPRLLWHNESKQWVMAVYDEHDGKQWIAFYSSPDLMKWTFQSRIVGFFECPDLYELSVEGKQERKWVLSAADGKYLLGTFDGKEFKSDGAKRQVWYGNVYAAQTFSNAPNGRRIQIGWGQNVNFRGMPFNQQMTVPVELSLRTSPDGVRLFAEPVKELGFLHGKKQSMKAIKLKPGTTGLAEVGRELDIRAEFTMVEPETIVLRICGVPLAYDGKKQELSCKGIVAPLKPEEGKVRLRILVDRGSLEVFGNGGRVALSVGVLVPEEKKILEVFSQNGSTSMDLLEWAELQSAWVSDPD